MWIDHIKGLIDDSIANIHKWDPTKHRSGNIELITGDGRMGYAKNGPYDAIHVGAAADIIHPDVKEIYFKGAILKGFRTCKLSLMFLKNVS